VIFVSGSSTAENTTNLQEAAQKIFAQEHALVSTQRGKITKAACAEFKVPLWIISAAFGVYLRVV